HAKATDCVFTLRYLDGRGVLRDIMQAVSNVGLKVVDMQVVGAVPGEDGERLQEIRLEVSGSANSILNLDDDLRDLAGVASVAAGSHRLIHITDD
ncbi:MAG: hypothetical protein VB036_09250, partial [Propionicimonas sp.]|nr:hypothetical protein [Propionicimonas sp.]